MSLPLFAVGEIVEWKYRHHLNSRSSVVRFKVGQYLGRVRHTRRWRGDQMVVVQFKGNKRTSIVPENELQLPK